MSDSEKATSSEQVKRSAVRGVFWTGGESAVRQVIQIATSLALARLLMPDDFGLLGMALVFHGIAQLLTDFGIGAAIVQRQEIDSTALSSAFWVNMALTGLLVLILMGGAPWIGALYESPQVGTILEVLALSLLLAGLRTIPRTLLYKDMRFDVLAQTTVLASFIASVTAVTLAWFGFGVWSLVAQPVVGGVAELVLVWLAAGWRPEWRFNLDSIRGLLGFGAGVFGANLINYGNRNADNLLIGKFLGSEPLGYYGLAYQIMLYPLAQISAVIVRVMFPALSRMQDDLPLLQRSFLAGISAIALVTFPTMLGLLAVSHDFIVVVFGEKWLPMEFVLRVFCIIGLLQSVGTTAGTVYLSTGNTKLMFKVTLYSSPFIIGSFACGLPWGIDGVAIAYLVVQVVLFFVLMEIALRLIQIRLLTFLGVLTRKAAIALAMYGIVVVSGMQMTAFSAVTRLSSCVFIGALSYVALTWLFNRAEAQRFISLALESRSAA